jgi:hypothetical protein
MYALLIHYYIHHSQPSSPEKLPLIYEWFEKFKYPPGPGTDDDDLSMSDVAIRSFPCCRLLLCMCCCGPRP